MTSPEDLDSALAELLARRAAAVDARRLSAHRAAVEGRSRALKRQRRRWLVAALPLVLLALGAIVAGAGPDQDRSAVGASAPGETTTLVPPLDEDTGGLSVAEDRQYIRENAPRPYVADIEQREAWIAAYESMRSCMLDLGFTGAEPVASTLGDGDTPFPIIDATRPGADAALQACSMDLTGIDADAWRTTGSDTGPPDSN